jgi:hypothetical protein
VAPISRQSRSLPCPVRAMKEARIFVAAKNSWKRDIRNQFLRLGRARPPLGKLRTQQIQRVWQASERRI